jgi:hypothetical protein
MKIYTVIDRTSKTKDVLGVFTTEKLAKKWLNETWPGWKGYKIIESDEESDT